MPTSTTNYGLIKPGTDDPILIEQLNDNADTIDAALKANADAIESKQDALNTAQLAAVNSGIDSDKVEDIDENRAALVEIVDSGAKNVVYFSEVGTNSSHGTTYVSNGVTFTLNPDFSITAERTATSTVDSSCNLRIGTGSLYVDDYCTGGYVLSGCPEGGGESTYSLRALRGNDYRVTDTGEGAVLPDKGANSSIYINMLVMATFEGTITFKPMICTKAAWGISQDYQPYRPPYQELYERVLTLEQANGITRSIQATPTSTANEELEEEMR